MDIQAAMSSSSWSSDSMYAWSDCPERSSFHLLMSETVDSMVADSLQAASHGKVKRRGGATPLGSCNHSRTSSPRIRTMVNISSFLPHIAATPHQSPAWLFPNILFGIKQALSCCIFHPPPPQIFFLAPFYFFLTEHREASRHRAFPASCRVTKGGLHHQRRLQSCASSDAASPNESAPFDFLSQMNLLDHIYSRVYGSYALENVVSLVVFGANLEETR
jgi:hypothetical protein